MHPCPCSINPLRIVLFGALGPTAIAFAERFDVRLVSNYGSTEVGFPFTNRIVRTETCHIARWLRPGYEARTIGPDGSNVAEGEVGELLIKPPHRLLMMEGYLGRPDATEKAIIDGWYHTGDAGYCSRAGPCSSSIGSVAGQEVLLVVRPMDEPDFDPAALFARLVDGLPKRLPAFIAARRDEFPKTPNGKIRKVELGPEIARVAAGDVWVSPAAVRSRARR